MGFFAMFGGVGSFIVLCIMGVAITVGCHFFRDHLPPWVPNLIGLVLMLCGIICLISAAGIMFWIFKIVLFDSVLSDFFFGTSSLP